jgi:hypothetical protein
MVAVAVAAAGGSLPTATASPAQTRVRVVPERGGPDTTFVLTFRAPATTGTTGSTRVRDMLSAWNHPGSASCLGSISGAIGEHRRGAHVRVQLNPRKFAGHWCPGSYNGQIEELQQPVCRGGEVCSTHVIAHGTIARFELRVRSDASGGQRDVTPPRFAGLERAFACTPGPQRPGQRTPYSLTWQQASDDVTPPSAIVYDVFYATTSRGEDFSRPSWTTAPGVTSFRTPGLPSHASAYFVVRARDAAGNEDANTLERAGVDPCL